SSTTPRARTKCRRATPPRGRNPKDPSPVRSSSFSHDAHLELELHTVYALNYRHHVLNQLFDVRRACATVVHDKVRVHLRHACATNAMTLEARGVDQARRVIARRIREHGAARPLADRLRRLAAREQQADVFVAHAGTLLECEARAEEPLVRRACDVAIAR